MNKLLLAAAVSSLALGGAAAAQTARANVEADFSARFEQRIDRLEDRLYDGIRSGEIDRTEARSLRAELRQLIRLHRQYARNGFTVQERQDLQARLRDLRGDFRLADGQGGRRDRYGNWVDEDEDGYYGQGGPYEELDEIEACESRGIGGLFGRVFGTDDCPGLRVGARAYGNLYAVPSHYGLRDGDGVYYRTDGRVIYRIDARTHTVLKVYAMAD